MDGHASMDGGRGTGHVDGRVAVDGFVFATVTPLNGHPGTEFAVDCVATHGIQAL